MSDLYFPAELADLQDSKHFSIKPVSNTIKGEMEGGYTHARPRTTRPPRKLYSTGFTALTEAQANTLLAFYDQVGEHTTFLWKVKIMGEHKRVRFQEPPSTEYAGVGGMIRYNVPKFSLMEA